MLVLTIILENTCRAIMDRKHPTQQDLERVLQHAEEDFAEKIMERLLGEFSELPCEQRESMLTKCAKHNTLGFAFKENKTATELYDAYYKRTGRTRPEEMVPNAVLMCKYLAFVFVAAILFSYFYMWPTGEKPVSMVLTCAVPIGFLALLNKESEIDWSDSRLTTWGYLSSIAGVMIIPALAIITYYSL